MNWLVCGLLGIAAGLGAQVPAGRRPESNRLWVRDPLAANAPWQPAGRAPRLIAMAALDGRLYGASVACYVVEREQFPGDAPWTIIGESWRISALAALDGKLYAANQDEFLAVSPAIANPHFKTIGKQRGIVAMAASDGDLFAVSNGRLLMWEDAVHQPVRWLDIGRAEQVTALAALDGRLYAATSSNRLFTRESALRELPWKLIGHAENITAMTAFNGKLYAAAYSPSVIAVPRNATTCELWKTNQLYQEARSFLQTARRAGKIRSSQDCLKLAGDPEALRTSAGDLADLIAGSCAQCACAAEFPGR